jgi:ElaB/YqjD/DUF883 family membrane-anchored ribosome-binding protein
MARATTNSAAKDEPSVQDLSDQIDTLRSDIEKLTELMGTLAKKKSNKARDRVSEMAEEAAAAMEDKTRHAMDEAGALRDQAETLVRRNPSAALGLATGIGFLVGLLLARR